MFIKLYHILKAKRQPSFSRFLDKIGELYEFIEKKAKRENTMLGVELEELTWLPYELLKNEIPNFIKQGDFERVIFEIVKLKRPQTTYEEVQAVDNYKKMMFFLWVQDQYKLLYELEMKYLSAPPDAKLVSAGIRDLDVLGDVNLIDSLAEGDILKWEAIRRLPYATIFDKQLRVTILDRVNKRLEQNSRKPK